MSEFINVLMQSDQVTKTATTADGEEISSTSRQLNLGRVAATVASAVGGFFLFKKVL